MSSYYLPEKERTATNQFLLYHSTVMPDVEVIELNLSETQPASRTPIRAVATVRICGISITGITVKQGKRGLFINMPQYRQADKTYKDLIYAITKEMQDKISRSVITAYKQAEEDENQ